MYAIVKVGGKQYRVEKGDSVVVDRMAQDAGAKVALEPLLFRSNDDAVFDRGGLEKVKVEAVVTAHERGKKLHVLKFKPKRGYKRRMGHRSELTRLEIKDIKLLSRKPAGRKSADQGQQKGAGATAGSAAGGPPGRSGQAKGGGRSGTTKARGAKTAEKAAGPKVRRGGTRKKATGKRAASEKESGDGS